MTPLVARMVVSNPNRHGFSHPLALAGLLLGSLLAACAAEAPAPVEVAAYYFPNYHPNPQNSARYGPGWTEWNLLQAAQPRFAGHAQPKVPAWGYEDEADPAVFARKISAAADHGVTAFIFDWYWHDTGPFLERGLEQGFLRATNQARLKFALMWANHDWLELFPARAGVPQALLRPGPVSRATFEAATDHAIKDYFPRSNYWRLQGKPYFSIYETMTLVKGFGGVAKTREALDDFRRRARAAGVGEIHLNGVAWGLQPPADDPRVKTPADLVQALGLDSVTSYCWIHHTGLGQFPATDYAAWADQSRAQWPQLQARYPVPYYPNVSMGWDSSPRTCQTNHFENLGYPFTPVVTGNTPERFRQALEHARVFLMQQPRTNRVLTINAWNEWTEGSYLEPDNTFGFKYLDAVKAVFGEP